MSETVDYTESASAIALLADLQALAAQEKALRKELAEAEAEEERIKSRRFLAVKALHKHTDTIIQFCTAFNAITHGKVKPTHILEMCKRAQREDRDPY